MKTAGIRSVKDIVQLPFTTKDDFLSVWAVLHFPCARSSASTPRPAPAASRRSSATRRRILRSGPKPSPAHSLQRRHGGRHPAGRLRLWPLHRRARPALRRRETLRHGHPTATPSASPYSCKTFGTNAAGLHPVLFPPIRYRTRDISSLNEAPCLCGRTPRHRAQATGRSDDLLIVRGTNVFPAQVEEVLLEVKGSLPHYRLVVSGEGALDRLEVRVEVSEEFFADEMKKAPRVGTGDRAQAGKRAGHPRRRPTCRTVHPGALRGQGQAGPRPASGE